MSIGYRRGTLVWGVPGIEAIKIATLDNDQTRCAVFAYDKGAQMTGMLAPAKRVGFFLYRKMTSYLTPEGWALFDAAVDWALAPEPKTPISIQVVSDGSWKTCAAECPPMETISNLNFDSGQSFTALTLNRLGAMFLQMRLHLFGTGRTPSFRMAMMARLRRGSEKHLNSPAIQWN